jgi:hypothetical protein
MHTMTKRQVKPELIDVKEVLASGQGSESGLTSGDL